MSRQPATPSITTLHAATFDAVIFDMDGVVTKTASVHAAAWTRLFNEVLQHYEERAGRRVAPFTEADYLRYVDGKPRENGVRDFLAARGITLPLGQQDDSPDMDTLYGLGKRKNNYFLSVIDEDGVQKYDTTVELIHKLHDAGVRTAIISASRNATTVLDAAGVRNLFEVQVDGDVMAGLGLPGKPDPACFQEAARRLNVLPQRAVVVEDAVAGVQAGRTGNFGLVIGVDRGGNSEALRANGADVVVADLGDVTVAE